MSASSGVRGMTMPPWPQVRFLIGPNEKQVSAPLAPTRRVSCRDPNACAASSMTTTPRSSSCSSMAERSTGRPPNRTGMTAAVLSVTASMTSWSLTHRVAESMSTKCGVAPTARMACTVAQNVMDGTITSRPGPIPAASRAVWRAAVPEATATASGTPRKSAIRRSNSSVTSVCPYCPLSRTRAMASVSSPYRYGLALRRASGLADALTVLLPSRWPCAQARRRRRRPGSRCSWSGTRRSGR